MANQLVYVASETTPLHCGGIPSVALTVGAPGAEFSVTSRQRNILNGMKPTIFRTDRRCCSASESQAARVVSRPPGGNAPDGVAWPWARFVADRDGQTHGYLMQRAKPGAIPAAVFRS